MSGAASEALGRSSAQSPTRGVVSAHGAYVRGDGSAPYSLEGRLGTRESVSVGLDYFISRIMKHLMDISTDIFSSLYLDIMYQSEYPYVMG